MATAQTPRLQVARDCYRAYETGDRALLERCLTEDFTFSSPVDARIDRATYFERCWPNHGHLDGFAVLRAAESGDFAPHSTTGSLRVLQRRRP